MQTSLPLPLVSSESAAPASDVFGTVPNTWVSFKKALRIILLLAIGISLFVNPGATRSWQDFAVTYGYTVMYSTGLWLTNGFVVTWLNRRYAWSVNPGRRVLLTLAVSLGGSALVIVLMNVVLLLIQGEPVSQLWSGRMYWALMMPLIITVIISL